SQFAIIITGDHSQSDLASAEEASVDLDEVLAEFQVVKAGGKWQSGDDLMVCPNMRAAQIYLRSESSNLRQQVVDRLLESDGIDQVMWCEAGLEIDDSEDTTFHVATRDRGSLSFRSTGAERARGIDHFGGQWCWEGDLRALDATVDLEGRLSCGDYPNAFERVATSFSRQSGSLWVTARLGREFCLPGTSCNSRGSHGSLHSLDSTSPLIVAGLPDAIALPDHIRTVDVVPLCLDILDLQSEYAVGASHVTR
ncbi:MAG TPA: hypothetical protein VMM76_02215, partial [Pirellulaceae bacterium]|nr:hypothetical protein [Pirellulaceae bacterium]